MNAKAIIPVPTPFQKFLTISGLRIPVAYVCTYLLEPICDWILSLGWLDQSEDDRRYAMVVRKACKRAGLDYYPVLLSEAETCATCGKYVGMLVQPRAECWPCWRFHVQETHRLILVAPGERPQLLT
jgi:hypothetical protein